MLKGTCARDKGLSGCMNGHTLVAAITGALWCAQHSILGGWAVLTTIQFKGQKQKDHCHVST